MKHNDIWIKACESQKNLILKEFNNSETYFKISKIPLAKYDLKIKK